MLMIACSNATALDKETATTSFIKSDKHIWDREGRALNLGKEIGQGSLITSEAAQGHLTKEGRAEIGAGELGMKRPKGLCVLGKTPCAGNRRWGANLCNRGKFVNCKTSWAEEIQPRRGKRLLSPEGKTQTGRVRGPDLQELWLDPNEYVKMRKAGKCIWVYMILGLVTVITSRQWLDLEPAAKLKFLCASTIPCPQSMNCKARALQKGSVRQGGRTTLVLRVFSFCATNSHLSKEATDHALGLCPGLSPQLTWGESRRVQHSSRSPRVAYACSSPRHAPLPQGLRPGPVLPLLIATPWPAERPGLLKIWRVSQVTFTGCLTEVVTTSRNKAQSEPRGSIIQSDRSGSPDFSDSNQLLCSRWHRGGGLLRNSSQPGDFEDKEINKNKSHQLYFSSVHC